MDAARVHDRYRRWLARQPLAASTLAAYSAQVRGFLSWLSTSEHGGAALTDIAVRDWAVRDYKRYVKAVPRRWAPAWVNQALAAFDNFYRHLGLGLDRAAREKLGVAPRALETTEQRVFLRAVHVCASPRDRAIATLLLYTGLRLSELAALDVEDIEVTARRGRVQVRSGNDDTHREVPLNSACRTAIDEWVTDRTAQLASATQVVPTSALWLSRTGGRMSPRAVDLVVRGLAADAGLVLSAQTLRHTCMKNLIRSGADVVLVAEIAGHRHRGMVGRYGLASQADKDAALEAVLVEP